MSNFPVHVIKLERSGQCELLTRGAHLQCGLKATSPGWSEMRFTKEPKMPEDKLSGDQSFGVGIADRPSVPTWMPTDVTLSGC